MNSLLLGSLAVTWSMMLTVWTAVAGSLVDRYCPVVCSVRNSLDMVGFLDSLEERSDLVVTANVLLSVLGIWCPIDTKAKITTVIYEYPHPFI